MCKGLTAECSQIKKSRFGNQTGIFVYSGLIDYCFTTSRRDRSRAPIISRNRAPLLPPPVLPLPPPLLLPPEEELLELLLDELLLELEELLLELLEELLEDELELEELLADLVTNSELRVALSVLVVNTTSSLPSVTVTSKVFFITVLAPTSA